MPPSLEVAAQKLEAGQRRALASESEVVVPLPYQEEVAAQKLEVEAAPQKSSQAVDLQAWQAKGVAKNRVVDSHPLATVGEFLILLVWLCFWLTSTGSGGQPAPLQLELGGSNQPCSWNWRAFHCSTGCKIRKHLPGLQDSCTLSVKEPA